VILKAFRLRALEVVRNISLPACTEVRMQLCKPLFSPCSFQRAFSRLISTAISIGRHKRAPVTNFFGSDALLQSFVIEAESI
jgi:hypothetical protein